MKCFLMSAKTGEDEDRGQRMWEPSERVLIGIPGIERKCFAMVGLFCWALTIDGSGSLADHGDSLLQGSPLIEKVLNSLASQRIAAN